MNYDLSDRVPILAKGSVTLYGRVINRTGKLGRYEVFSDFRGFAGPFLLFSDAQDLFNKLAPR